MNTFFTQISQQHYQQAYEDSSPLLQEQISGRGFEALARDFGLNSFNSCKWKLVSSTAKEAHLDGDFFTGNPQPTKLHATLLWEAGAWRLYSLQIPMPDNPSRLFDIFARFTNGPGFNDAFTRRLPTDDEIRKLVSETILKFNESLHQRDFHSFYLYTSALWQSRMAEEQVARAFKPYIDSHTTLDAVKDAKIIFDEPPRISSDGYLIVNGYYPTQPRVVFKFQYVFELPKWKIIGIQLSIEP